MANLPDLKEWWHDCAWAERTCASHRPLLWRVLEAVPGPILEFGMGLESTPYLVRYSAERERELVSVESNADWYTKAHDAVRVQRQEGPFWTSTLVADYDHFYAPSLGLLERQYGVALIDHGPVARRRVDLGLLANAVDVLVVHDSNQQCYKWDVPRFGNIFGRFRYRYDDILTLPNRWTTALSNRTDVQALLR